MTDDEIKHLRARLERALAGRSLDAAISRYRAIVGPMSDDQAEEVKEALGTLQSGDVLTPTQLAALQRAVRAFRPAVTSRKGDVGELSPDSAPAFPQWSAFRDGVKPFLYTIGRIDRLPQPGFVNVEPVGTGFLVTESLLVTNRHVLDVLSSSAFVLEEGQAVVRFRQELQTTPDEKPLAIVGVAGVHDTLDLAILEIEPNLPKDGRLPLRIDPHPPIDDTPVVTLGYPFNDSERNPYFIEDVFGNSFGVKRAAPGEIFGHDAQHLFHDCSTLGGNSGSPVVSMATACVVGVHQGGGFATRNEAVRADALQKFIEPHIS